jgi:hypothetical protein
MNEIPSVLPDFNRPSFELINGSLDRFIARNKFIFPDDIKARWYAFRFASSHHCLDHFITLQSFINTDIRFSRYNLKFGLNNVWNQSSQKNTSTSIKQEINSHFPELGVRFEEIMTGVKNNIPQTQKNTSTTIKQYIESNFPELGARFEEIMNGVKNDTTQTDDEID